MARAQNLVAVFLSLSLSFFLPAIFTLRVINFSRFKVFAWRGAVLRHRIKKFRCIVVVVAVANVSAVFAFNQAINDKQAPPPVACDRIEFAHLSSSSSPSKHTLSVPISQNVNCLVMKLIVKFRSVRSVV